jgi:hypothetical protein
MEEQRRQEKEFHEDLKTRLYEEELEEKEIVREQEEAVKRHQYAYISFILTYSYFRMKIELSHAREYQLELKEEKRQEEKRMEGVFKKKMMEKFAEDDRIEQMNAQKRRMKELEHKKEVCCLFLSLFCAYRWKLFGERDCRCSRHRENRSWKKS